MAEPYEALGEDLAEMQQRALLRLHLKVTGDTHRILSDFLNNLNRAIQAAADEETGKLDVAKGVALQQAATEAWDEAFARWLRLFRAARRVAAWLPVGQLAGMHALYFGDLSLAERRGPALVGLEEQLRIGMAYPTLKDGDWSPVFDRYAPVMGAVARRMQALTDGSAAIVYSDGHSLSERIWQMSGLHHGRIQGYITSAVTANDSAWNLSKRLERYVRASAACPRWTSTRLRLTKSEIAAGDERGLISGPTPCDSAGVAYAALRLARNEIQIVHQMATDEVFGAMPWVQREYIRLSPDHPNIGCDCEDVVAGGPWADRYPGLYPKGEIILPIHVQCLCYKEASLMDPKTFAGRARKWMTGEKAYPALDQYMDWLGVVDTGPIAVAAVAAVPVPPGAPVSKAPPYARIPEDVREDLRKMYWHNFYERERLEQDRAEAKAAYDRARDFLSKHRYRMDREEYHKYQAERDRLWAEFSKLDQQLREFAARAEQEERDLLYVEQDGLTPAAFKFKFSSDEGRWKKDDKDRIKDGVPEFRRVCGLQSLKDETVTYVTTPWGRSGLRPEQDTIEFASNRGAKTVIHEMSHWLEEHDPDVHDKVMVFFERRTQGESEEWLGDFYGRSEKAKKDKFPEPYCGKVYRDPVTGEVLPYTEIVSQGMEMMYDKPYEFASADPEYFDFLFNLMRGW